MAVFNSETENLDAKSATLVSGIKEGKDEIFFFGDPENISK